MDIITKASAGKISGTHTFVLSTEVPDRVGDVVKLDGMDLKNFESNPVALYMHNHVEPIGMWKNLRRQSGALIGDLMLASRGTSRLVDFAHSMISQGMLKAVSVSFLPLDSVLNKSGRGRTINKSELIEVSLVTVPMNPQALMVAKSLGFSDVEIKTFFSDGEIAIDAELEKLAQEKSLRYEASLQRARLAIIQAKRASRPNRSEL